MIDGGWPYVLAAYAVAIGALAVLAVAVATRLSHWSRQARAMDERRSARGT